MRARLSRIAPSLSLAALLAGCAAASGPADPDDSPIPVPTVDVGADAYERWERLPYIHIGERVHLRSTYDRSGGNEGADASHFLRQEQTGTFVALDVEGPGVLSFARANHWHGSPWHYSVDGQDHVVQETSTADPTQPVAGSVYMPEAAFPPPLAITWAQTRGADLSWVPIPFERSFSIAYERTHYGTGYFIYHLYPEGADNLSRSLLAWDESPPPASMIDLLSSAGQDIAPSGPGVQTLSGNVDVPADGPVLVARLDSGPAMVRALRLVAPAASAEALSRATLRVTWDDRPWPSIEAPVPLFFGTGTFVDREGRKDLVKAPLLSARVTAEEVTLAAYFPMPFFHEARIELAGGGASAPGVSWQVRTVPYTDPPSWVGYFHATYQDQGTPVLGRDLVLLDTTLAEGGGDHCGSVVGTSFTFSDAAVLGTLEGDPRFFFDGSDTPQVQGTGTEEWGGGGDYWGGMTSTLPLAGHPVGAPSPAAATSAEDAVESAYRLLVGDAMPFGRSARIQLEHGGLDQSMEHYRTLVYWYGAPGACLVPTDTLHVGDPEDEARHDYASPDASEPETVTSRHEWGVDQAGGVEVYPEETFTGRHTPTGSTFTLRIDPVNHGVLLRRKLDYAFADQRATVWIAGPEEGAAFERAGVWYLAGSNTCVYSNPPGELDPPAPKIQTSNRRLRDDEFLVPARLTSGRSSIRVRIEVTPGARPVVPGMEAPPGEWSELLYQAFSYVLPGVD